MGDVVQLTSGRVKPAKKIPKPVDCEGCGEPIETARLQALEAHRENARPGEYVPKPRFCFSCQTAIEARHKRQLSAVRDNDVVIIRGR